jgi:hypothetical protein
MRILIAGLAALAMVGCGAHRPVSFSGPTATQQPLQCVAGQFETLGYSVAATTPASSITGLRINQPPIYLRLLGFRSTADQITATVAGNQLQVTATSSDPSDPGEGGRAGTGDGANRTAERHARQIVGACASS